MSGDATTAARRPSLTEHPPLEEIVRLLARREPIYRETADFIIDTEGRSPGELAMEILRLVDCKSAIANCKLQNEQKKP